MKKTVENHNIEEPLILTVKSVINYTSSLYELQLDKEGYKFTVGDCAALYSADGKTSRPYSIASGTNEPVLRFIIRKMPDGVVSTYLGSLRPGKKVQISMPFGWFRPGQNRADSPFVFIATGSGIAPFLAFMKSYPKSKPAYVLYGVKTLPEAVGYGNLKRWSNVDLAVSREKIKGIYNGRLTGLLDRIPLDKQTHYYLCGIDSMVEETGSWLEKQGIDITSIHREVFFNAEE
ncbi:MAG: hypothetical protein KAR07_11765 [Spirochaetes bacterium]|nr:hypothetical protein [Spirochaetota bacterium]